MHNRNVPRRRAGPERAGPAGTIGGCHAACPVPHSWYAWGWC